jgi:hypothetical protein
MSAQPQSFHSTTKKVIDMSIAKITNGSTKAWDYRLNRAEWKDQWKEESEHNGIVVPARSSVAVTGRQLGDPR